MTGRAALPAPTDSAVPAMGRRGRPRLIEPDGVLDRIRRLAARHGGLFRVHRTHASLYARARRLFGSWSAAVIAAGLDYAGTIEAARRRSAAARRRARRSRRRPLA